MKKKRGRRPMYLREAQILFGIFENIYHNIKKGDKKAKDDIYSTIELMNKIGWKMPTVLEKYTIKKLFDFKMKQGLFYNIMNQMVKPMLEKKYSDLQVINITSLHKGKRGYKVCVKESEFDGEINKTLHSSLKKVEKAQKFKTIGAYSYPKLAGKYFGIEKLDNKIRKTLPKPKVLILTNKSKKVKTR